MTLTLISRIKPAIKLHLFIKEKKIPKDLTCQKEEGKKGEMCQTLEGDKMSKKKKKNHLIIDQFY